MRTVGYRHHGPRKDHQSSCAYCGDAFLRSELYGPDENGFLACADDRPGRVEKELDYIRALNASQPSEVRGARDWPGTRTPMAVGTIVGYAWITYVDGKTKLQSSDIETVRIAAGDFELRSGAEFDFAAVTHFDSALHTNGNLPLLLSAGQMDSRTLRIRCRNRFDGNVGIDRSQFMVLLYANSGVGALNLVSEIWVKGSTAETLDSDGSALTVARSSAGLYTLTLTDNTYRVGTISQFVQGDPSNATPVFTGLSHVSETVAGVVIHATNGNLVDGDFFVRLFK